MDERQQVAPEELLVAVADQVVRRRAGEGEPEVAVEQHHAAPALLDNGPEAPLALFELVPQLFLGARAGDGLADDVRRGAEEGELVLRERPLLVGVDDDDAEGPVLSADRHPGAGADAVIVAEVRRLEPCLFIELHERERRVLEQRDHRQRLILVCVERAVRERLIRSERGADVHRSAGVELERAAMRDLQRQLDQRARLPEEDERIDAGERGLPELRHRDLLPVPRLQL
jgi:hypothetical protein